jgi:FMN phosphatase YigB (HAD superfamily)
VLSNTNDLAVEHIRRTHPFFHGFDGYLLSYEVGVMKPHDRIYAATEQATGMVGADLLFIDDKPENIETALKRGWQGIIHRDSQSTLADLGRRGIPVSEG